MSAWRLKADVVRWAVLCPVMPLPDIGDTSVSTAIWHITMPVKEAVHRIKKQT